MYEDRVLAFIDILGFSEAVKRTITNGMENEDETTKIVRLFDDAKELIKQHNPSFMDTSTADKSVHHFSDSIIISYPKTKAGAVFYIISETLFFSLTALQKGFLIRGAVVCDKLCHTETKIFGPAMVKAYQMESKLAVYPRIILDDNILDIAKEYPREMNKQNSEFKVIQNLLLEDFDGYFFINYLDIFKTKIFSDDKATLLSYFEPLRNKIRELDKKESLDIKSKCLWLKGKYKGILSKYKKQYYNDRTKAKNYELYEYIDNIVKQETAGVTHEYSPWGRTQKCRVAQRCAENGLGR
jgi:hypothetical protein